VPAATTAAVAAFSATFLTLNPRLEADRVLAFDDGRTADVARANFVLTFAVVFVILDLTGARFEDVLALPRLAAFFMCSSISLKPRAYPIPGHEARPCAARAR
jgi:hypothetical protein